MANIMKNLSLFLINFYQKYISPYKGFNCAYRVATGEIGCSGYGKKVISRFGFKTGYSLLQRRFEECKCSSEELKKDFIQKPVNKRIVHPKFGSQGGFVDCGGCDVPHCDLPSCDSPCDSPSDLCDFAECCDIPDCGSKNKRKASDEKYTKRVQKKMEKKAAKEQKNKVSLEKKSED
jgi:putative component of membrane protein insertase Oxa1/YidC/SpoIIIJ protein YidD